MAKRPQGEWSPSVSVTHPSFNPYALAIGQLTLAWNDLHVSLAMLFCTVMGGGFSNPALAIWHSLKSDRAQRDMLLAAMSAALLNGEDQALSEDIKYICKRADVLEEERNNALHSPLWGIPAQPSHPTKFGAAVVPVVGLGHIRANKLLGKDLLFEFRWCRDSAIALRDYATRLDFAVCQGRPLPDRPQLPNRGRPSGKSQHRPVRTAKRPPPPRSSRA